MAARLALRGNEANHYQLRIAGVGQRRIELVARVLGVSTVLATQPIGAGVVKLQVEAFQNRFVFSYRVRGQAARTIGTLPTADLSSEKLADLRYLVGMFAGGEDAMAPADFVWSSTKRDEKKDRGAAYLQQPRRRGGGAPARGSHQSPVYGRTRLGAAHEGGSVDRV